MKITPITHNRRRANQEIESANELRKEELRERAIAAFNATSYDSRIVSGPANYMIFSKLQWKDFRVENGHSIRQLPTAHVTRSYWFHRLWNKFKALFKKRPPVIPPEIVAARPRRSEWIND